MIYTVTFRFANGHSHTLETEDKSFAREIALAAMDSVTCIGVTLSWVTAEDYVVQRDVEAAS